MKPTRTAIVALLIILCASHNHARAQCLSVVTNKPLYYASNPIYVSAFGGNSSLVGIACAAWRNAINQYHWSEYWQVFVSTDFTARNEVSVDSGVAVAECNRTYDLSCTRIVCFSILTASYSSWCQNSAPSLCSVGMISYLDVITHEIGHAVGMDHCEGVCQCVDWQNLAGDAQADAWPTMAGGDWSGVSCMSGGYIAPYVLDHTLSTADWTAAGTLYTYGVVRNERTVDRVVYDKGTLRIYIYEDSGVCGDSIVVLGAENGDGPPRLVPGEYVVEKDGEVCAANVEWQWAWRPAYIWIGSANIGEYYGPYQVEWLEAAGDGASVHVLPNPANPVVSIVVNNAMSESMAIKIYDVRGRQVAAVYEGVVPSNTYAVQWGGQASNGEMVSSGAYAAIVTTAEWRRSIWFSLIR